MNLSFNAASIVQILWALFLGYWIVSAFFVKKDMRRDWSTASLVATRLLFAIVVATLFRLPYVLHWTDRGDVVAANSLRAYLGVLICAAGIGFAIWARRHLGSNWSGTPSVKAGHELVTTGPYRFVRHPIYTGIITGLVGTAFAMGWRWLVMAGLATLIFGRRVGTEEKIMMELFPGEYPEYKKRTQALIPFVY